MARKQNPNSLKNLKPFEKGDKRINKNGRPKKLPQLDKLLIDVLSEEQNGISAAEAILKVIRNKALRGDVDAAEKLLTRAYGKPKETVDINSTSEEIKILSNLSYEQLKHILNTERNDNKGSKKRTREA